MKKFNKWVKPFAVSLTLALATTASYANSLQVQQQQFQQAIDVKLSDLPLAVERLKPLAEQGNVYAQGALGAFYEKGMGGVKQDDKQAMKWFQKAAEQGHAAAQYTVGIMYHTGRGVKQDYQQAVKWYRKSAEQGYIEAQYNLGTMYYHGKGVRADNTLAKMWFSKACDQGFEVSCESYRILNKKK